VRQVHQGSYEQLCKTGLLNHNLLEITEHHETNTTSEDEIKELMELEELEGPNVDDVRDLERKTGDTKVYRYYFETIGFSKFSVFIFFAALNAFSDGFKSLFLCGTVIWLALTLCFRCLAEMVVRCTWFSNGIVHFYLCSFIIRLHLGNWWICLVSTSSASTRATLMSIRAIAVVIAPSTGRTLHQTLLNVVLRFVKASISNFF
jgi:hypothetical protein